MISNYFNIEREDKCTPPLVIRDENNKVAFEDLMNMSYDEMKVYKDLELFVDSVMDVANECFDESDAPTMITLVGKDDVFIWGILLDSTDDGKLKYALVDWRQGNKSFKYQKDLKKFL